MHIKMEVTFSSEEVKDFVRREYIKRFGEPMEGYELWVAMKSWGEAEVSTQPISEPETTDAPTPEVAEKEPVL